MRCGMAVPEAEGGLEDGDEGEGFLAEESPGIYLVGQRH